MAEQINESRNAGLTPQEIAAFKKANLFGAPLSQIKSFLQLPEDKLRADLLPGIPAKDTANNEMVEWMRYVVSAHAKTGTRLNLIVKGDNNAKYPQFKNVIDAFKKNDQFKFQMVTNPKGVPEGTDLWKRYMDGGKIEE